MEIEEIISQLKDFKEYCDKNVRGKADTWYSDSKALDEAIQILEKQIPIEHNYEDCNYCCNDVDMRDYITSDGNIGIYIDGEGQIVSDDELGLWDEKINYCPKCGRKLEVEED